MSKRPPETNRLEDFKENLSKRVYGISRSAAQEALICISCREPAWKNIRNNEELNEYRITALCGVCWDKIFPKDQTV